jgi:lysine-N-methylase
LRPSNSNPEKSSRPDYAERFRCIGPACEDTCCQGWSVPIDQAAWKKYQTVSPGPLRTLLDESILRNPVEADPVGAVPQASSAPFAKMKMTAANGCPLHNAEGLCRIHAELGEAFLSTACATYPRIVHSFDGHTETALSLSCPEAARVVLLNPQLLAESSNSNAPQTRKAADSPSIGLGADLPMEIQNPFFLHFETVRSTAVALVQNRAYPLWQRMFLLGILCRRLDSIGGGEVRRTIPAFLRDFGATVVSRGLHAELETVPADHQRQLDLVLQMAGMLLHRSNVRPRFVACIEAFTAGIGNGPGATLESLTATYGAAHDRYFAPFFRKHPHILENYLLNTIFRCQFPFGRDGSRPDSTPSLAREFALLTSQFALMKGLLIGVAGFHGERFSAEHVVHTVQAASKHFEHHPEFLTQAHTLLSECQMDGARGLAILLRNVESHRPQRPFQEKRASGPQTGMRLQTGVGSQDSGLSLGGQGVGSSLD